MVLPYAGFAITERLRPGLMRVTSRGKRAYWKRYYNTPLGAGTKGKYIAEVEEMLRNSYA